jgi:hypothetical protein
MPTKNADFINEEFKKYFWSRVVKTAHCWEWSGSKNPVKYYGTLTYQNKSLYAHRVAWVLINGQIPKGKFILHSCDNPPCVRLDHLRIGDHQDNVTDCINRGRQNNQKKKTCPRGHKYDSVAFVRGGMRRYCILCKNQGRREKRRAAKLLHV